MIIKPISPDEILSTFLGLGVNIPIFSIVCFLSPGLILSGLYPRKNPLFSFKLDSSSMIEPQIFSVTPG